MSFPGCACRYQWPGPYRVHLRFVQERRCAGDARFRAYGCEHSEDVGFVCMLPMIGAERCFEGSMRDQHPGWLRDWQKTTCVALNVVCNGVRWVADLVCQTLEDDLLQL